MFFLRYEFLVDDEPALTGADILNPPASFQTLEDWLLTDLAAMPSEASAQGGDTTIAFGTDGDDVILGTDATEEIHGGAGADIIVGDGMTLADLHAMGALSDEAFDALSLPADPIGDIA